jgi:hypothetical protein
MKDGLGKSNHDMDVGGNLLQLLVNYQYSSLPCAPPIRIAAQQIGIAKGCLYDMAMPYLMERKQFGTAIGDFQVSKHARNECYLMNTEY